ncbi:MAG: peroxiredoxin [Acidimicrobiales bacterium]|nr:peroxiredoxin [Acidimicrobiales bacterium]
MQVGDAVPDFELDDQDGNRWRLSERLVDGPVVLFFYPAAMTAGCTKEACHFRDLAAEFGAVGAQRVGISLDGVDTQKEFSDKHGFDYPLLADTAGKVARIFGVKRPIGMLKVRRQTFVIGADGILVGKVGSELNMDRHADEALEILKVGE